MTVQRYSSPPTLLRRNTAPAALGGNSPSPAKTRPNLNKALPEKPLPEKPLPALPKQTATKALPAPGSTPNQVKPNIPGMRVTEGAQPIVPALNTIPLAPGAKENKRLDAQGPKVEKNVAGGTLTAQGYSGTVKTVDHHQGRTHQGLVNAEFKGPNASFVANKEYETRLGKTSMQVSGKATSLEATAQGGYDVDASRLRFQASGNAKFESSAEIHGQIEHKFNEDLSVAVKGDGKVSAGASLEGRVVSDPANATFLAEGRAGGGAIAEGSVTGRAQYKRVAAEGTVGGAAGAGVLAHGKAGVEKGKVTLAANLKAGLIGGHSIGGGLSVDTSHHPDFKNVKTGLVHGALAGMAPALAGLPEKETQEQMSKMFDKGPLDPKSRLRGAIEGLLPTPHAQPALASAGALAMMPALVGAPPAMSEKISTDLNKAAMKGSSTVRQMYYASARQPTTAPATAPVPEKTPADEAAPVQAS